MSRIPIPLVASTLVALASCGPTAVPADEPECPAGFLMCGDACASVQSDPTNCGECGTRCASGELCIAGACTAQCGPGTTACEGLCVSLRNDPTNCGECGTVCRPGEVCSSGNCSVSCQAELTNCSGSCRDLSSDRANCGGCGKGCAPGEVCASGDCVLSCAGGLTDCSGACRDLTADRANCGACGAACDPGEVCSAGDCVTSCGAGLTDCSGACRDLSTDRLNCGACGTACAPGEVCSSGDCVISCGAGLTDCSGSCRDLTTDRLNCGGCGNACAPGESCVDGDCVLACSTGLTACGGSCTNTSHDPLHCGGCGSACQVPANAVATCGAGICGFVCAAPHVDCDRNAATGCEVNVETDALNCGSCGNACPIPANASAACVQGACGIGACRLGNADCDDFAGNGCEANLNDDEANCGSCGFTCDAGHSCTNGLCSPTPTKLIPGNTTLIVQRDGVEATCHQWSGNLCTQPKLRPLTLSCSAYAYRNEWHAIHYDGNFYCYYATGDRTVVTVGTATWQGPPTVHGVWSFDTCTAVDATVPHGHPAGALSTGTHLAWDYARGAIGEKAVQCVW